jgi:hypothetical protein
MKNTKHRENETMAKFNDFLSKLKGSKTGTTKADDSDADAEGFEAAQADKRLSWMSKQVQFHIDSEKAYQVTKAAEFGATVGTGKNFEDFKSKKNS